MPEPSARICSDCGRSFSGKESVKPFRTDAGERRFRHARRCPAGAPSSTTPVVVAEPLDQKPRRSPVRPVADVKVEWKDGVIRPGWTTRYLAGTNVLRCWPAAVLEAHRANGACLWLAVQDLPSYAPADDDTQRVLGMFWKLLRRGAYAPLPTSAETALLAAIGNIAAAPSGRVASAPRDPLDETSVMLALGAWEPDALDSQISLDSDEELLTLSALLEQVGGDGARVQPQAPLDDLVRAHRTESRGRRRLDFLVFDEQGLPVAVEVDGEQHSRARSVDRERDGVLRRVGLPVHRFAASTSSSVKPSRSSSRSGRTPDPGWAARRGRTVAPAGGAEPCACS